MTSVYSVIHDPVQDSWSIHSHRVVRLTEARVGIEDGLWLNRLSDSRKNLNTYKTKTYVYTISQRNHYLGTLQT